jgi:hypothetical protein
MVAVAGMAVLGMTATLAMARYSSWMMLFNAADVYFDRQLNKRSAPSP